MYHAVFYSISSIQPPTIFLQTFCLRLLPFSKLLLSTKHCDFRVAEFYSNTVLLQFRSEPHVLEYHIQIIGYNKANSVLLDLVENVKLI